MTDTYLYVCCNRIKRVLTKARRAAYLDQDPVTKETIGRSQEEVLRYGDRDCCRSL
jgi:hypothetical protein